jgi:hypothetical protein
MAASGALLTAEPHLGGIPSGPAGRGFDPESDRGETVG